MLSRLTLILAAGLLVLSGCLHESHRPSQADAVLYTIGSSTDPYGKPSPRGFGVATGVRRGAPSKVEVYQRGLGGSSGAEWLNNGLILVPQPAPPLRPPLLFGYDGQLKRDGTAPIPGGAGYAWFTRLRLFVFEPAIRCNPRQRSLYNCYRASGKLFVAREDGADKRKVGDGHMMGWTADGRIAFLRSYSRATTRALDPSTGETGAVFPRLKVDLPIWSPDRRFVAAQTAAGVVVARADGRIVRTIRSRLATSMITWARRVSGSRSRRAASLTRTSSSSSIVPRPGRGCSSSRAPGTSTGSRGRRRERGSCSTTRTGAGGSSFEQIARGSDAHCRALAAGRSGAVR